MLSHAACLLACSCGLYMILMHPCLISHTHSSIKQDSFLVIDHVSFCNDLVFSTCLQYIYLAFLKFSEMLVQKTLTGMILDLFMTTPLSIQDDYLYYIYMYINCLS